MSRIMLIVSLLALVVASVGVAEEAPWFDMENCAMCASMHEPPELLQNVQWEQHNISNGIVAVTSVPAKYLDAYRAAHAKMAATGERLAQGEQLQMCGSCTALGMCMMKGVKQEYVETSNGDVWILMSDNPEVVADLHAWVKRNQEEMAKMQAEKG